MASLLLLIILSSCHKIYYDHFMCSFKVHLTNTAECLMTGRFLLGIICVDVKTITKDFIDKHLLMIRDDPLMAIPMVIFVSSE